MADDMDSDTCVGSKRRVESIEETHPQLSGSPSAKNSAVSPLKQQDQQTPSPLLSNDAVYSKKVKSSPDSQALETHPDSSSSSSCPSVKPKACDFEQDFDMGLVHSQVGLSGGAASVSNVVEKEELVGNILEVKKKQLLEQVEAFLVPQAAEKNTINIGLQQSGTSFKAQLIDETALIGQMGFLGDAKNVAQVNGKKARAQRRKQKKVALETNGNAIHLNKVQAHKIKITYSMKEMEAMRFFKVGEQKKLWKSIYNGLGAEVAKEYDNLASGSKQNIHINSDNRKHVGKMGEASGYLGESLGNLVDNEIQDASLLDPVCNYNITNEEDAYPVPVKECSEDDDSEEEYASIQRPAFYVEGEPDFDSGSPEDGFEYLRRVRWEAAQIPKVRVAKLDRSKLNKEQSAYMPNIPEIAKCPEQFLPMKQWEDAFLAEFSELRLALSRLENPNTNTSQESQSKVILHEKCCTHQLRVDVIIENFGTLKTTEVDCSIIGNCNDQPSLLTAEGSSASTPSQNSSPKASVSESSRDPPLLSVILKCDSVARVSMLRKRIKAGEDSSTLSRDDCLWLFALCAVVDTPLHADTSASVRSLLRKCAALRAAKSTIDDELIMLNILATIAGRYFGQSEN